MIAQLYFGLSKGPGVLPDPHDANNSETDEEVQRMRVHHP
jgi:hypothetical protein